MARADVIISQGIAQVPHKRSAQTGYTIKVSATAWYQVIMLNNNIYWVKSVDGGFSWSVPVAINSVANIIGFATWFDKWTPGDTGTKIHISYYDTTNSDVYYRALDTSGDSLGTEVVILAGASLASAGNSFISMTKCIGGNLLVLGDFDAGTEKGLFRSTDGGANWTTRTDPTEGSDYAIIMPGFAADTNDAIIIFWDRSADEISRKVYDDSADSTAETSIATSMVDFPSSNAAPGFAACVDDANNKILLAAWSNADTLNADLRFWTIDETTITEGTNIVLNSTDDQWLCALGLATDTATIHAFYAGKSDGSETWQTSLNIYLKKSTDGGTTWGSETQVSTILRGYDWLQTCPVFTGDYVAIYRAASAINSNLDILMASVLVPTAGGSGGQGWWG